MSLKPVFPLLLAVVFLGSDPSDGCQPPEGVQCGDQTCEPGQYCRITYPGVYGADTIYTCEDPPEACQDGNLTCDCLVDEGVCVEDMAGVCSDGDAGPTCSFYAP